MSQAAEKISEHLDEPMKSSYLNMIELRGVKDYDVIVGMSKAYDKDPDAVVNAAKKTHKGYFNK